MAINIKIKKEKFLPCYWHLLDKSKFFDIEFLYGGRDSGKSRHIAMQLVLLCMSEKYFKCLLIRKVLNTVRDSQFALIKSIIEEWGISHLFRINDTRMEIKCINGNGFFGRGLDDVGRIKSFVNPSHCWVEEGNQVEANDFVVVLTSLRAEQRVKTYFSFNPECAVNYTEFWLWQDWFSHTSEYSFEWTKTIETPIGPVDFNVRATHTTYNDNPYCSPQRMALYESYKSSKNNAYWYQTYTLGLWGYRTSGNPFWKCFDEARDTKKIVVTQTTVHVVLDDNVNPYLTQAIWQVIGKRIKQVHEIPCYTPDNNAPKAARKFIKWLQQIGYDDVVYLYGDPSSSKRSTIDENNRSFYDKYIGELEAADFTVVSRVGRSAPQVAVSGAFVNEIYESNYDGWTIEISDTCRKSIEDYIMAQEDIDGSVLKKKVMDKETKISYEPYGHFSDAKRYFITTILKDVFEQYKSKKNKYQISYVK